MSDPEGNSQFCFPESLDVSRDEVEDSRENKTNWFSEGPDDISRLSLQQQQKNNRPVNQNSRLGTYNNTNLILKTIACVAWRFCRAGRTSGEAARKVAPAPISLRFLCPRPPSLLSAPNQNRHATQAIKTTE